jgi:hypothetical protein
MIAAGIVAGLVALVEGLAQRFGSDPKVTMRQITAGHRRIDGLLARRDKLDICLRPEEPESSFGQRTGQRTVDHVEASPLVFAWLADRRTC